MATTKITTDNINLSGNTGALEIPTGTTDQRPGSFSVEYLVVAGGGAGGGGGNGSGGGGGAGGYLASTAILSLNTTYTVTVGDGGAPFATAYGRGSSGENSFISGTGLTTITAIGGGGGGYGENAGTTPPQTALSGGSGGGAGRTRGSATPGGTSTPGQGNDGGSVASDFGSDAWAGGGGGGSSAAGQNGAPNVGGNGGSGTSNSITGSPDTYAAGGGGGVWGAGDTPGTGGDSSAGNGGEGSGGTTTGGNGTDNTGSGAGGGGWDGLAGTGGSGVIILRYSDTRTATYTAGTGGVADAETTVGSNEKYIKIKAGTGTIVFTGGTSAVEGTLRENTTTGKMEVYTGTTGWRALQQTGQDVGVIPSNNFNTVLYTGNSSTQSLTVGFKPDWVIVKSRTQAGYEPTAFDTIRGALERLRTSENLQEDTKTGSLTSFDTDGFTTGNYAGMNSSGQSYVAWCWKAGGSSNTFNKDGTGYATATAAGLTAGTITPTGSSVNTETGFSIIKYQGTSTASTVPHGLGATPELIFIKSLNNTGNWITYSSVTGVDYYMYLNTSDAPADYPSDPPWTNITSTTFGINGTFSDYNNSSTNYIAYCFASIPGYSQIGYYIGTDVTSGNQIYTGFKPAWLMVRNVSTSKYWYIVDNKRSTTNPRDKELYFNTNDSEVTANSVNFLDYGFELATTDSGFNDAGNQYLFMAFSE